MVTEPNIDKDRLRTLIEKEFGIRVLNLTFNPKGWASWSYIVDSSNAKYFFKIYKDTNFDPQVFEFTNRLSDKCEIKNISYPIKTKSGNICLILDGYKAVLFNYISGVTASKQKLNDDQLEQLGELLAKIHKSKDIIGPYPKREDFDNPFKEKIVNLLNQLDKVKPENEYQEEAKGMYLRYKDVFLNEIKSLDQLRSDLIKMPDIEFVNCHGEPSPNNIMIGEDGEIYLIDWDFPFYAPKEKDLIFFEGKYSQIFKEYGKISQDKIIHEKAESFYQHLWKAQEISDYGTELLLNDIAQKEYEANLNELKHFLDYSGLCK